MSRTSVSFTNKAPGRLRALLTYVGISEPYKPASGLPHPAVTAYKGLWDTGATGSVITKKVATDLGLLPTGKAVVHHADGTSTVNVYLVNIVLPNNIDVHHVRVTEGVLAGFDVLIGMDIITLGDFAVTNVGGRTTFSFRIPSIKEIDFKAEETSPVAGTTPITNPVRPRKNDLCSCGSGKKYKYCHGRLN